MKLNVTILEDEATHAAQLKQLLEKERVDVARAK